MLGHENSQGGIYQRGSAPSATITKNVESRPPDRSIGMYPRKVVLQSWILCDYVRTCVECATSVKLSL